MAKVVKRQTDDGHRWVLDFFDQEGRRQRITMRKGKTRSDAEKELAAKLDEVDNATFVSKKAVPLFSKVTADWLEVKKSNLRESTYSIYEGHTKNHFPEFESRKIRGISVADVERYISKRQQERHAHSHASQDPRYAKSDFQLCSPPQIPCHEPAVGRRTTPR
jgi:integrase